MYYRCIDIHYYYKRIIKNWYAMEPVWKLFSDEKDDESFIDI